METTTTTLMPFPCEGLTLRESWPIWEIAVYDYLESASPEEHGLLGFAMSTERFTALTEDGVHQPHVHPGVLPPGSSVAQTATHKYNAELCENEQVRLKASKKAIIASLGAEPLGIITEATHGTRRRTIMAVLDMLRDQYGTLTAADLKHQKLLLLVPYQPGTPIRDYMRQQRNVHNVCTAAGQALSNADKVDALRQGVKHVPAFADSVKHFTNTVPTVAAQTFEALATLLGQAEDNGDPHPTTGTAGYSAASTSTQDVFSMATVSKMVTDAVTKALKEQSLNQRSKSTEPLLYCWTHGPGRHSSQDCKQPKEGHVNTATNGDRKGGATGNPRFKKS